MIASLENGNLYDLQRRGMLGTPVGLPYWLGWSYVGDTMYQNGRYQVRRGKNGPITVQCRHYWPDNNPTARQLAIRQTFREGVIAWHALTPTEKAVYNNIRYPEGQTGFTRHMTWYLKTNL